MKVKLIAIALSLFALVFSAQANNPKNSSLKKSPPLVHHKIDLNKADVSELTGSIKGIGKKRAEAIIAYRKSHNGFKSVQELGEVKGLGQHFMGTNKDKINEVFTINSHE